MPRPRRTLADTPRHTPEARQADQERVTFIQPDGLETILDGVGVMRTAVRHGVPGIVAECGGSAMCATCHVSVEPQSAGDLPEVDEVEDEMLDCTAADRLETSRLSCRLPMTADLVVRIAETQV